MSEMIIESAVTFTSTTRAAMMAVRTADWHGQQENSTWRSSARDSFRSQLTNSPPNARLSTRVDTTPSSRPTQHVLTSPSNTVLSISSTPHTSPPPSSPLHIASYQPAVIDLTIQDTEGEPSVRDTDMLAPNSTHLPNPPPSHRSLSSAPSSPLLFDQSLFTPPPPSRRRARLIIDHLEVPSFPNGLTKADYQPISLYTIMPPPGHTATTILDQCTPSPRKRKGKERNIDVASPPKNHKRRARAHYADMDPNILLDAFYEPTEVPLYDDDTYPPLTSLDLATNSRFQFAHAWRAHASRLREADLDWTFKFGILGKASIWAQSLDISSPCTAGTTGYVSIKQLRPWQLVPLQKSTEHISDEQAHATESHAVIDLDAIYLPLPCDPSPVSSVPIDSAPSHSAVFQTISPTVVDTEHVMNQYFNGLNGSRNNNIPSGQQLALTHTFSPHPLQSDTSGLGFPSLDIDLQLADTIGHGASPSPTTVDMELPLAPGPIPDSPFEHIGYFAASQGNSLAADALLENTWSLEQGEDLLEDNSPPSNDVLSTSLGTINPSLLDPEQPLPPSLRPKRTAPKRRSNLPDPVIYIRRPLDPSALPLVSGKRPVQIKYRDLGSPPATPSTQTMSNKASSNPVADLDELPASDTDEPPPAKRRSIPSRKLREVHTVSEPDSDYIPDTSRSKLKLKSKRSVAASQRTETGTVSTMSFCHQCRNTSVRPKMLCSNTIEGRVCGKRFCNRCILYRYPDVTFDEHSAGFLCPVCTNTCNCSHCSRSRGEEFVSMRLGGLAASIFKSKLTLVRDEHHRSKSPNIATQRGSSMQSQFWAHVYGMEGEHVGSAFMPHEQMERLHTSSLPPLPNAQPQPLKKAQKPKRREKKKDKSRGPRVFIGKPLTSWKVHAVHDLEPSVDAVVDKGKGRRGTRWYVGNPAVLHEPYGRMPGTASPTPLSVSSRCSTPMACSDGSLTPLSEPAADFNWPQPEVGECCDWAPPSLLGLGVGRHALDPGQSGLSGSFGRQVMAGGVVPVGTMDVAMDGDERGPMSMTLSDQDLARAISAALFAVNPC